MNLSVKNLSLVFMAGLWGGLLNCLAVWLFGWLGIAQALGVQNRPAFDHRPPLLQAGLGRHLGAAVPDSPGPDVPSGSGG